MSLLFRLWPVVVVTLVGISGCEPPTAECRQDADCGAARVCAAGVCVECGSNEDCVDDSFCCQGVCRPAVEVETRCGCGPSPAANPGETCTPAEISNALCLVGDSVATTDNVAQGICGCGCTPAQGGTICSAPTVAGAEPVCSCAENADCRQASVDATSRLHRAADTCTPDGSCVCFSLGTANVCDPDGASPDCASVGGCMSLALDRENCGKAGRSCIVGETGIADTGACIGGGCACDNASDCAADGLNVNTCAFPVADEPSRCVCNGFTISGVTAPCPMELVCVAGGCLLDGTAFGTDAELRGALGLP